jgi:hypothetical protein
MERFEALCPGFTERTLRMAEQQGDNRRYLEKTVIIAKIKHEATGQWMACVLSIVLFALAAYAIHEHQLAFGAGTMIATLGSLVGMFNYRQKRETARAGKNVPPGGQPQAPPNIAVS